MGRPGNHRRLITVYGRKTVLEALQDSSLECSRLHLASSNRRGGIMGDIEQQATARAVEIQHHSREALSRISRNGRQDQGVALDVLCPRMQELEDYLQGALAESTAPRRLMALDGVTNPQNVGMVIRSALAAGIDGILYADRGNPALGPLVIKASAGTLFRAPLLRCATPAAGVSACVEAGFDLYRLQAGSERNLFQTRVGPSAVFVLGGESEGISREISAMPGSNLSIPMDAGVESLNIAVSAALVAYASRYFDR